MISKKDLAGIDLWACSPHELFKALQTSPEGLSESEGEERLEVFGKNEIAQKVRQRLKN